MKDKLVSKTYRLPVIFSVILHLCLIIALCIQVTGKPQGAPKMAQQVAKTVPVQAVAVNAKAVERAIQKIKTRENLKKTKALAELKKIQVQQARIKRQRYREQKRLAALKAKQKAIAKKAKAQAIAAKKLALQKARAAAAQKKALAAKQAQKQLADKRQALAQQLMAQQLRSEQSQIKKNENDVKMAAVVDEYSRKISGAIGSYWNKPSVDQKSIKAILSIDVGPGGVVLAVRLAQSSGNALWDRQALAAAQKASPLPVPKDPRLFDKFRHLRLTVAPT